MCFQVKEIYHLPYIPNSIISQTEYIFVSSCTVSFEFINGIIPYIKMHHFTLEKNRKI